MSPKATPRQARERGRRSKDKSEQRSPDMEESNEYMDSSISRPSSDISREDFIHFENAIAPYLHELAEVKRNIATSLHAVDELMDGLTGTFKGRMDIVKGVGETWGKEEEQSKKIEELTAFNEQLLRWSQEKGKELEDKIQTLIRERDHAQVEKEELEQKYMEEYATREQDLKDREKRLHSDYEKKMKALEIQKAEAKKELEKGKRLEIRGLNITIEKLTEENERHKCDLADLKNLVEKTDRAYESLGRENNSMRDQVDVIQRDFWVPEKPDDYFAQRLEEIEIAVGKISSKYFTDLPESAIENGDHVSRVLKEKSRSFEMTPITGSYVSVALRRANVQHVIMQSICHNIWQPLFCEALWKHQEARLFLGNITSALSSLGFRQESAWRAMTLRAAENCTDQAAIRQTFLRNITEEVLEMLQPLIEGSTSSSLGKEMENLFVKAIELWSDAQMDGSRITAVAEPSQNDMDSWKEALPGLLPEDLANLPTPSRPRNCRPLFLFPNIVRISQGLDEPNAEYKSMPSKSRVLYRGCALFPDTNIFSLGSEEQEHIGEAIKKAVASINRRNSTAKTLPLPRNGNSNGIETRPSEIFGLTSME